MKRITAVERYKDILKKKSIMDNDIVEKWNRYWTGE
jgi:hypothetical protein